MTNAVSTTKEPASKSQTIVTYFESRAADFEQLMQPGVKVEAFLRVFKNALIKDPEIAEASTQSIFIECQKCAQDGLVLDGREAVLTRFKTNRKKQVNGKWVDNWQTEVVYIPMIRGLKKIISKSPVVASWSLGIVYKNEIAQGRFKFTQGDDPHVYHEPIIDGERGERIAAYSVARLRDGSLSVEIMTREEILAIKARTKSVKKIYENRVDTGRTEITGPWATDEAEMWRKTVARRHFKSLPLEGPAMDAVERVDNLYDFTRQPSGEFDQLPAPPPPKAVANKRTKSAAAILDKTIAETDQAKDEDDAPTPDDDAPHDPDTGEVLEGEIMHGDAF